MADGTIDMTIEQQVCSLELAKRLKELGVKQESLWWWASRMDGDEEASLLCDDRSWMLYYKDEFGWVRLSAFTVAELGEMLSDGMDMTWKSSTGEWNCRYTLVSHEDNAVGTTATTEADARAKMLIYLLENKLIAL